MSSFSAIHAKESLLRLAVDGSPAGLIIADETRRIVLVNQTAGRMFGYEAEELVGQSIEILLTQTSQNAIDFIRDLSRLELLVQPITVEQHTIARRKDSTEFPVDIRLCRVQSEQGGLVLASILDATQRQRTELAQANQLAIERLMLVGQSTGSVTQQRQVQSERLAAIGQTVTVLAHESRNALQRARSCLDLIELDLQGQSEPLDMTQRIREALGDLQRIYEEVRNYAAPIVLQQKQVDFLHILQRAFQDLQDEFPSSKHRLLVHDPATPISLQADEYRLWQAFRNILANAIAASSNDSDIEVHFCRSIIDGRNFQEIHFQDFGDGMDESTLSQLFEPFYTTKQSGTGLGMAMCKRIVESHGGRIVASSVKGRGSTITLMLPSLSDPYQMMAERC